jgi:hypothetical protein
MMTMCQSVTVDVNETTNETTSKIVVSNSNSSKSCSIANRHRTSVAARHLGIGCHEATLDFRLPKV